MNGIRCALTVMVGCMLPVAVSCFNSTTGPQGSGFANKLEFGSQADMAGQKLLDAGGSFAMLGTDIMLWFRVETEFDQAGNSVVVTLQRTSAGTAVWDTTMTVAPAQNYGHIMLHNFYLSARGTYTASATVAFSPAKSVGSAQFTVH